MDKSVKEQADKNIFVFGFHRSGSMFIHGILKELCKKTSRVYYSPNDGNSSFSYADAQDKNYWQDKKGCFGVMRCFIPVPSPDDCHIILHLRDPRDVVTSMFYSYCYTHPGPVKGNTGYRKEVAENGIDDFALRIVDHYFEGDYGTGGHLKELSGSILERYQSYVNNLIGKENVTFIKYEEMVGDFRNWLAKIARPFHRADADQAVHELFERHRGSFGSRREDPWGQKKRKSFGGYKDELKPRTIAELNTRFKEILMKLEYDIV